MRRALRASAPLAVLVIVALSPGCVVVPRYLRGTLADPAMDGRSDALSTRAMRKFHWAREGAAGGDGLSAGGGCGCGT